MRQPLHECTGEGCDEVKDKAAHSDGNSDGKCDTCGYTVTTETPDPDPDPVVTEVEISAASNVLTVGGSLKLTATVLPAGVSQQVTWSISSGSGIATVTSEGVVTATGAGKVVVRATADGHCHIRRVDNNGDGIRRARNGVCVRYELFPHDFAKLSWRRVIGRQNDSTYTGRDIYRCGGSSSGSEQQQIQFPGRGRRNNLYCRRIY